MSRISFDDTPEPDGVAERVMLEDIVKLEGRVAQLEGNINMFIRYVASVRFVTAERDSAPWMSNWEANLLSGTLVAPTPYVEPEVDIEAAVEAGELGVADNDAGEEFVIVDTDVAADVADEDALATPAEIVDVDLAELPPADVADEDALVDETAVDDSEPPLSAA